MNFNVRILETLDDLIAIREAWHQLEIQQYDALYGYMTWQWVLAFIKEHRLNWRVLAVEHINGTSRTIVGIVPINLLSVKLPNDSVLELAVTLSARYAPYTEYLVHPDYRRKVWHTVTRVLKGHFRVDGFLIGRLHETSLNHQAIVEVLGLGRYLSQAVNTNYWLNTRYANFTDYYQHSSSTTFQAAEYAERRLHKSHTLTMEYQRLSTDVIDFIVKQRRIQHADDLYYKDCRSWGRTYQTLWQLTDQLKSLDLKIDGVLCASYLLYSCRDIDAYVLGGVDQEWAKYSLSKVMLAKLVKDTFEQRRILCFGQGHFHYKQQWANQSYRLYALAALFSEKARLYWPAYFEAEAISDMFRAS